ncbi:hypothetical protein [Methanogenium cariaci]|uniref:hypothetical protein n=1 Tax=Methanogenium cariaci TaxID=2197 RepID=UPI0007847788|nr:hypothetical protein [Methanogenium cariaci]
MSESCLTGGIFKTKERVRILNYVSTRECVTATDMIQETGGASKDHEGGDNSGSDVFNFAASLQQVCSTELQMMRRLKKPVLMSILQKLYNIEIYVQIRREVYIRSGGEHSLILISVGGIQTPLSLFRELLQTKTGPLNARRHCHRLTKYEIFPNFITKINRIKRT